MDLKSPCNNHQNMQWISIDHLIKKIHLNMSNSLIHLNMSNMEICMGNISFGLGSDKSQSCMFVAVGLKVG